MDLLPRASGFGFGLRAEDSEPLSLEHLLGGSWVVVAGVTSPRMSLIHMVTLLLTPLITTHEPPSRDCHTGASELGTSHELCAELWRIDEPWVVSSGISGFICGLRV